MPQAISGIDPTISLGINPPQIQGPNIGMLGQFATVQNALNQNRLFQQTFAARQRLGEIMSSSPDVDTAFQRALSDPLAAPFAGPAFNAIREGQATLLKMQGEQQTQAQSGLEGLVKALGPAMLQDPSQFGNIVNAEMATLSPTARARVAPAAESIRKFLTDGLEGLAGNPEAQRAQFGNRVGALMTWGGFTPDAIRGLSGVMAPHYEAVGPGGALAPVGGPAIGTGGIGGASLGRIGPTVTQRAEMEATGKAGGDIAGDMVADASELPGAIKRLDMMQGALTQFQAGPGAEMRARIAETLSAMGASKSLVDKIGNTNLSATQLFEAEVKPFAINMLKQSAQGTGRVMRSEVDQFLGMLSAAKTPEALMDVLNQTRYGLQVGYDRANQFMSFKQLRAKGDPSVAGLDLADFPMWYNQRMNPKGLPTVTPGGLQLGPVPRGNAMGVGSPQANPLAVPPPTISSKSRAVLDKAFGGAGNEEKPTDTWVNPQTGRTMIRDRMGNWRAAPEDTSDTPPEER